MADVYTASEAVVGPPVGNDAGLVKTAYDRAGHYALRSNLVYDAVADVRPRAQAMPGETVVFHHYTDAAEQTTELVETQDVDLKPLATATSSVTLAERGDAFGVTAKLKGLQYALEFDASVANRVGRAAAASLDSLARTALYGGSNVSYIGQTSRAALTATDKITSEQIRTEVAELRAASVEPFGQFYVAFMHPYVAADLRGETGDAGWNTVVNENDPTRRWVGYVGNYEGCSIIETPRAPIVADGGAGNVDVYQTLILGRESLAKAHSDITGPMPQIRIAPPVDALQRLFRVGWYWLGGYGRFREESIRRIEHASPRGANT